MRDVPPGVVVHVEIEKIYGQGPWRPEGCRGLIARTCRSRQAESFTIRSSFVVVFQFRIVTLG